MLRRIRPGRAALWLGALTLLLAPFVAWMDFRSVERGNRLFRMDEHVPSVRAYRRHLAPGEPKPVVSYNLGTAWQAAGSPTEAEARLREAAASAEPEVRYRASYNLGHLLFMEAQKLNEREMSGPLLGEAVLAYREALRVRPASEDARWSLEVAMTALDSVMMRQVAGQPRVPTRADPMMDLEEEERGATSVASAGSGEEDGEAGESDVLPDGRRRPRGEGAREALAEEADDGRTAADLAEILASVPDDSRHLLRRILWLEGPKGWFGSQPARGGRW